MSPHDGAPHIDPEQASADRGPDARGVHEHASAQSLALFQARAARPRRRPRDWQRDRQPVSLDRRPGVDGRPFRHGDALPRRARRKRSPAIGGSPSLHYDLDGEPSAAIAARRYDTIVAVNVIEHIRDDLALWSVAWPRCSSPAGSWPSTSRPVPFAYGSLDRALGHYRRYTPESLAPLLSGAGLQVDRARRT